MKRTIPAASTLSFAALLVAVAGGYAQDPQAARPEFTITISAPQATVKLGAPIALRLTETNVSDHDLLRGVTAAGHGDTLRFMNIKLYDSDGKPVPETEHGRAIHGRPTQRPALRSGFIQSFIKKGESFHEDSDLGKEFVLDKPGTYTVQAEQFDYPSNVLVKSNTITLTLTQ